ncbi:galactofuranose ABC transporter, permease protein YjfF [Bacillus sp. FSL K6-3431]|uniref:galactofuranose ABC transporter, permease protein YjfF n=1 Tax=Bacillus sp. FSL K6-3431 TaxID=2921500 RepID=UPI0030FBAC23
MNFKFKNPFSNFKLDQNNIIIIATLSLLILLYTIGAFQFRGFLSVQVFFNFFIDNAHIMIVATGLAFVIITGGIDLSIASVIALISMISASLLQQGMNPYVVMMICLVIGIIFGSLQGYLIYRFRLHPWIVTLAGMFFARGSSYLISTESIVITNKVYNQISKHKFYVLGDAYISVSVVIAIIVVIAAIFIGKYSRFGRAVYAIGGSEKSAVLMGLPVKSVTILVYSLSSFCAALGGIVFTFYMLSGYSLHLLGAEMDAIAACVIGGILLTGGFGYIIGPTLGVLCMGIIQTMIMFQGSLSSWWTKIVIGFLLFVFIVLQRVIVMRQGKKWAFRKGNKKVNTNLSK